MNAQQIRSGTRNKLNACVRVSGKEKPVMKQGVLDLWFTTMKKRDVPVLRTLMRRMKILTPMKSVVRLPVYYSFTQLSNLF